MARKRSVRLFTVLTGVLAVAVVVVLVACLAGCSAAPAVTSQASASAAPSPTVPSEDEVAWADCTKRVLGQLKAPSTAVFPPLDDVTVQRFAERGEVKYLGFVDAQNGFGAQIRTKFTCVVRQSPTGSTVRVFISTT